MKKSKIIDTIYMGSPLPPSHLRGNVLEIKNTSDKNYNLKVGNTLVSPVCSVDSFSALEKESNGRIGTLGIVASQSTRSRTGAITDIIPVSDAIGEEDLQSYPFIPIADMSLSSSINLSDEEWDTLRAAFDANDGECPLYQAMCFSEDAATQMLCGYMPKESVDGEILELASGLNVQVSSDIIMMHLYWGHVSEGYVQTMFIIQRNGDSASAVLWNSRDAEEPSVQVGSSFKDTIKLFMQKVSNFGLQAFVLGPLPEQLAHKMVNLLIPSVTALTVPSFKGVYIRNTNSWDTVVTSKNIASMLPRMEHVDATNELPDLKWGTCYNIYFDDNVQGGLWCSLPYRDSAIAPDQLLMIRIALNTITEGPNPPFGLLFSNCDWIHWINDTNPIHPADQPSGATRGVLNIIVCAFGVGYTYWTNN